MSTLASSLRDGVVLALLTLIALEAAGRLALGLGLWTDRLATGGEAARRLGTLQAQHASGHPALFGMAGLVHHPTLGWTADGPWRTANVHKETVGDDGRRITAPPGTTFPSDCPSIALMGDSFVWGLEVDDDQAFAWRTRERIGCPIANFGTIASGLDQVYLRWQIEVKPTQPDVVVLGMNEVIAMRVARAWDTWAKPWFELDEGSLVLRGVPIPSPEELALRWHTPRLPYILAVYREGVFRPPPLAQSYPLIGALFDALHDEVHATGATLVVVHLPIQAEYVDGGFGQRLSTSLTMMKDWCERPGVRCVLPLQDFLDADQAGVDLVRGTHWPPAGHALIADRLAPALAELVAEHRAPATPSPEPAQP